METGTVKPELELKPGVVYHPPVRTTEQYEADKEAGIERIGIPEYAEDFLPGA